MTQAPLALEPPARAEAGSTASRMDHGLLAVLAGPFAPRTWLAGADLGLSLVIGLAAFVVVTVLVVTGVALIVVALVGLVLLVATLHLARGMAAVDRARI